jgi:hypothetical protein
MGLYQWNRILIPQYGKIPQFWLGLCGTVVMAVQLNVNCSNDRWKWSTQNIRIVELFYDWPSQSLHNNKGVRLLVEYIGVTVSCPGFQPAGHTSPCSSVYWKAWTNRSVSSTLRPTGKSFIVIWRNIPRPSIMKRPLSTHLNKSDYNSVRCNGQFTNRPVMDSVAVHDMKMTFIFITNK